MKESRFVEDGMETIVVPPSLIPIEPVDKCDFFDKVVTYNASHKKPIL